MTTDPQPPAASPATCPHCKAPIDLDLSEDGDVFYECGSFDDADLDDAVGVPCGIGQSQECKITCLTRERDELREALTKISKARKFINGMVIDLCPDIMCYASQTIDVAVAALASIERKP